jgi:hypothetical protein
MPLKFWYSKNNKEIEGRVYSYTRTKNLILLPMFKLHKFFKHYYLVGAVINYSYLEAVS